MRDPYFERTVVLLCQHTDEGALGLVINKDGPVPVGAVLKSLSLEPGADADAPTWWGGPVGRSTGFVVWRGQVAPDEGWTLAGEIAVSPSVERLGRLVEERARFNLCLGYAGWSPEQLEDEIARGSWLYADPDAAVVFDTPPPLRYDRALGLLGLKPDRVWMQPINE